ncbi:MAG: phospholipid carrier-dependent glycosyltransferase [Candidatus Kerfeldbacteria bacterium]|nr:phospholipid carrier-dependent glycosyltransferase [Candidatus Kerfeldbacteria bacterium]
MKSLVVKISLIVAITLLAAWLRLPHLGAVNLYNDEYYQFETAVGQLKLGEWVRYDYYTEAAGKPYDRAKLFIYQVVGSLAVFGETESAARLPAAVWGIVLVPLVILGLLHTLKHPALAYLTGVVLAFDDFSIGLSRYVRMYSMLMVLSVALVWCVYQCLETHQRWKRLGYGLASSLLLVLSFIIFKELTLALVAAIGVYTTIRVVTFAITRQPADRAWTWFWIAGGIIAVVAVALTVAGMNVIPLDAVIVRTQPHWSYLLDLFVNWRLPIFAAGFCIIGSVLALKQLRGFLGYSAVLSLTVLSYFTFFSHRWDAQRYISIVTPLITLLTVVGMYATLRFLFALLPQPNWLRFSLVLLLAGFIGPWVSLTGVPGTDWLNRTAYADQSATELGYADMRTAYAYVANHVQPGEVVLMQGPRYYYWPDRTVPIMTLGGYKSLTLDEFKALAARGTGGSWVVYNTTHQRHLRDSIKLYLDKHYDYVGTLADTGVVVYHFTK